MSVFVAQHRLLLVGKALPSSGEKPTKEVSDGRRTLKKNGHRAIPQREIPNLNLWGPGAI
jgi:hypothetical protein